MLNIGRIASAVWETVAKKDALELTRGGLKHVDSGIQGLQGFEQGLRANVADGFTKAKGFVKNKAQQGREFLANDYQQTLADAKAVKGFVGDKAQQGREFLANDYQQTLADVNAVKGFIGDQIEDVQLTLKARKALQAERRQQVLRMKEQLKNPNAPKVENSIEDPWA